MSLIGKNSRFFVQRLLRNRFSILNHKSISLSAPCVVRTEEEITEYVRKLESKNWQSYGYDYENKTTDRLYANWFVFLACFIVTYCTFSMYYLPDYRYRDWAMREAYIVLNQKERDGIPPVDKNFVDPEKLELPSEEELKDTHIYI
nr:NADH dehydrogenase [ubiquinone] 1 beta subcomplex subunit 11, mitochondrial-like [Lepeophtheirus salmonis]